MQFSDAYYNRDNNRAGASCALLSMHSDLTHCDLPVAMTTRALSSTSELSRMSLYWRANPESLPGGRAPLLSLIPPELAIVPFLCFSSFFSLRCIVFWIKFCSSILHVLLNPLTISLVVMICFTRSFQVRYIAMLLPSFPNGFIYIFSLSCKCLVDKVPYYDINLYFEFGIFKFIWSQLF